MILRSDHPQSLERNREGKQSQNFHCYCELLSKSLQEHMSLKYHGEGSILLQPS